MIKEPSYSTIEIDNLDWHYDDCVIGRAFVVPIKHRENFEEATRTKLIREVAGRTPERLVRPASDKEARVSCTIGKRL